MKVEELPQDVLLELAQRLNVGDLLAFLSTCHVIRQLRFQRSLWLGALIRLKEIELQPLPLSTATPLETLSLLELQSVARRADRLKRNWQSNNPRLVHLRRLSLPDRTRIVFVPGAHLAVAYALGIISCWDILSSQRVAHLEIPDLVVRAEALCMDINGQVLIGASIDWLSRNLAVICIDFRDRAHISISHVVSLATIDTYTNPTGFFIDPRGTGFVDGAKLIFWCMDPDVAVQTTSLERTHRVKCLPLGRNIYLLPGGYTSNGVIKAIRHPASNSDRTAIRPASSMALQPPLAIRDDRTWTTFFERDPHVFAPHYGIFTVTSRSRLTNAPVAVALHRTVIHFRPGRAIRDELEIGEGCVYEHNQPVSRVAVGTSGTYVALLFVRRRGETLDPGSYLGLVHCDAATPDPQATFRMLDVGDVVLRSGVQVALDDALGLVLLVDREGEVTILSYA